MERKHQRQQYMGEGCQTGVVPRPPAVYLVKATGDRPRLPHLLHRLPERLVYGNTRVRQLLRAVFYVALQLPQDLALLGGLQMQVLTELCKIATNGVRHRAVGSPLTRYPELDRATELTARLNWFHSLSIDSRRFWPLAVM